MFDAVFDSCVLIDYDFGGGIAVLAQHFAGRANITRYVRDQELGKGLAKGKPDPCLHDGVSWIGTLDLDSDEHQLADELTLLLGKRHRGEAEGIAVCHFRRATFCSRDADAIIQAAERGVTVISTSGILNALVRNGVLPYAAALVIIKAMAPRGIDEQLLIKPSGV
ncbi:MAG: hypothetical protein M3N13_09555 [Candidatus Eremiobacteraeota bacterium]|nr:hypothetical protein [Candidatus Eremiobacteraeota bacterium]